MSITDVQARFRQLGEIRLGDTEDYIDSKGKKKGSNGSADAA